MKKTETLKKNYEFKNTFKKGKYFNGNIIEIFYTKNNENSNYIGIAVSSKLYNAVKRNKIKRIIRESYSRLENSITIGNTFVFLLKKQVDIEMCELRRVEEDMYKIFKKIGILKNEESSN